MLAGKVFRCNFIIANIYVDIFDNNKISINL